MSLGQEKDCPQRADISRSAMHTWKTYRGKSKALNAIRSQQFFMTDSERKRKLDDLRKAIGVYD